MCSSDLTRATEPRSTRQQRHLSYIAEFNARIRHISGSANVVADALSRPPVSAADHAPEAADPVEWEFPGLSGAHFSGRSCPPASQVPSVRELPGLAGARHLSQSDLIERPAAFPTATVAAASSPPADVLDIADAQPSCADCQRGRSSTSLRVQEVQFSGKTLLVDTSTGVLRPLVPAAFRRQIFDAVHSLAHPGIRATRRMIASRYVWPNLAADINRWCRDCLSCQRAKVTSQPAAPPAVIPPCPQRFSQLHIDIVGPLPSSPSGFSHLLTVVDRAIRWFEAVPLAATTAEACADALLAGWVSRYGVPSQVTSDRGAQFTSALWAALSKLLGIRHILTTPYHPQSNGLVERLHRRLKDALKSRLAGPDWYQHLPLVLLGLRAAPRDDSGVSAAELTFGAPLMLPGPLLDVPELPPEHFAEAQIGRAHV